MVGSGEPLLRGPQGEWKAVIHKRIPAKKPTRTTGPTWSINARPAVSHQRIGYGLVRFIVSPVAYEVA